MRVIAGIARGRQLQALPGKTTRPIPDRVKESLFSILQLQLPDARFLDLFAGTGSVGIEALSRGAAACDFVESAPQALEVIRLNLEGTDLAGPKARALRRDVFAFLAKPSDERDYDFIYAAPPQYQGLWRKTLEALDAQASWLADDGILMLQIDPKELQEVSLARLVEIDRRRYGNTMLIFYARPAD